MLRNMRKLEHHQICRKHVATLTKKMALKRCTRGSTPAAAILHIPFVHPC
jgi:hypothetical protein